MTALDDKIAFARKHWQAPGGEPFEIEQGEWLYEEYWRPAHSFRLVPVDKSKLCGMCAAESGELAEEYTDPGVQHEDNSECAGLRCEPIQFVFLDLPRRSGKTTGTSGLIGACLFKGTGEAVAFVAGSEDQSDRLFEEHYQAPILENQALEKRARIVGNRILCWHSPAGKRKNRRPDNRFEFLPTSISGTTGGKYTRLILEEARNIPADVAMALIPAMWDQNGWVCPVGARGHTRTKGDLDDPQHPTECDTCGSKLQPWVGQLLAMSSAGEITGGIRDWFFEAVDEAEKHPHPRVHVYRAQDVINKRVAKSSVEATAGFFSKLDSAREFAEIETSNVARRRGEDFLSQQEIASVIDPDLRNQDSGERPAVAFLDTSNTGDLSSLVILEDDSGEDEETWSRVVTSRIVVWDPQKQPGKQIDERLLETELDFCVPRFKLLRLRVDDRHHSWVRKWVKAMRKDKRWGRIVVGCTKDYGKEQRRFGWDELERYILARCARIQDRSTLKKELRAARNVYDTENRREVREVSRRRRHLDVAEALAGCCYDAHTFATSGGGVTMADLRKRDEAARNRASRILRSGRSALRNAENQY